MKLAVQALVAVMTVCGMSVTADSISNQTTIRQAFDIAIPIAPMPLAVGNDVLLVYELHLTNFSSEPLRLERVRVSDATSTATLLDLSGQALDRAVGHIGPQPVARHTVPPGQRAVIYVEARVPHIRMPAELIHLIDYAVGAPGRAASGTVQTSVEVDTRPLPILSPPLRGKYWTAVYEPSLERGHRRVLYAVGGKARIPGRFAIDWMATGPKASDRSSDGLGAEVLAVADGVVASTRDGVQESAPGLQRPRVGMAEATGNYISIDIGNGKFAFYEHLLPGLSVKPGQRVRRGQAIGKLGSTGQASRPHLHFHLADADSPLAAEGLPFLISGFKVEGGYASIAAFEAGEPWQAGVAMTDRTSFPAPNVVVSFD